MSGTGAFVEQPEVLEEVQLRAVTASTISGLAVVGLVVLYGVVPGHYPLQLGPFLTVAAIGGVAVVLTALLPWRQLVRMHLFVPIFSGRAVADMALVSAAIAFSGGSHSDIYLIYLVMCVFMAAASYPRPVRVALTLLVMTAYVTTLAFSGWDIGTATILFRLGMIAVIAGAADFMSMALTREIFFRDRATRQSQERANLWSRVAGLGSEVGTLDEDALLAWAVDSVREMGFEGANFCTFSDLESRSYRVVQARGLPEGYARGVHSSEGGMPNMVRDQRRTVVAGDNDEMPDVAGSSVVPGFGTVIGTPIWVDGDMAGVLIGACRKQRRVPPEEIAAFELLGAHASHGLETARKLEHQRRDAAHFRSLITSAPDAMVVMDPQGQLIEANHQFGRLFGYETGELVGLAIDALVPEPSHPFRNQYREIFAHNPRTIVLGANEEVSGRRKDGTAFPIEVVLGPIDAPEGLLVTATVRDVTERKEFERRLAHQATHDHLTGLPNRPQFVGRLAETLARTPPGSSEVAVCFLDVDHFKYVNDSRGHTIGDELVAEVGRRISSTARAGDMVARFGGDEFAVLVEGLADRQGAVAYAWRLLDAFDQPFVLEGVECFVSASVGIAFGSRGDNPSDLLRDADAAMYHAKQRGRARVELFDDELTARASERLDIESSLHQALIGEQLSLAYQPVMDLSNGSVIGMEALLRWDHPERGPVPPLAFVPIAEESGLILHIGRWVLLRAAQQAAKWLTKNNVVGGFSVSVNVSNRQLEQDHLIADVAAILESSGLPPACLVIEITESFFMSDTRAAVRRLNALKRLGVRIAIDDFGTGFSSLNSLARLPIDMVKIDKSFTNSLGTRNDAIVEAVIDVARAFALEVVAEGVETESQRGQLLELGCTLGQGFLFGRPEAASGVERLITSASSTSF